MLSDDVVFLLDVDNTLLDNDRFVADLNARLEQDFGAAERDRYWKLYATQRDSLGYADYLSALQQFRSGQEDNPVLLQMSAFLLEYPFAERLYPGAHEVITHLSRFGVPVILSDGDAVFQPRKVQRSGLWDAVEGRVMIPTHKERTSDAIRRRFPARHYVAVDDKTQLLAAMKRVFGTAMTTVFVRQGHYAREQQLAAAAPPHDLVIEHIDDLRALNPSVFSIASTQQQP